LNSKIPIFIITILTLFSGVRGQDVGDFSAKALVPKFDLPDSNYSNSGSIKLSWGVADSSLSAYDYIFELQQSPDPGFDSLITRYTGPDLASYVSGLKNGVYHYRVRSILHEDTSSWSHPIVVTIEHHSLQLAFTLFGLGAIVFIATVVVVIRGVRGQNLPHSSVNEKQGGK